MVDRRTPEPGSNKFKKFEPKRATPQPKANGKDHDEPRPPNITKIVDARRQRRAQSSPEDEVTHSDVPTIEVKPGLRHEQAVAGLKAMKAAGVPFYQRDRFLVRVASISAKDADGHLLSVPGIVPVGLAMLARALGLSARWIKYTADGSVRRIDPPREVVEQIGGMLGEWPFAPLSGVIGTQTMRPDGGLILMEGYDPATGLYLHAPPLMPAIAHHPTKKDALEALETLNELISEFPFKKDETGNDGASRSVAMSMLMTPVLRGALAPAVPMHVVDAPMPGSGKSYLADLAAMIALGERCAVMTVAPREEETEKRLIAAALNGYPILAIDNCNGMLAGDFLCQVTERPMVLVRPLGGSDQHRIVNTFMVFANGNNIVISKDLTRRVVRASLDANREDPTDRTFTSDPVRMVQANRGKYIAAILTIARAYHMAGYPVDLHPMASFERWSRMVCGALVWLGWDSPMATKESVRADDPDRERLADVLSSWPAYKPEFSTQDLIDAALEDSVRGADFREAILPIATLRGVLDTQTLAYWLRQRKGRMAGNLKLERRGSPTRPKWAVTEVL